MSADELRVAHPPKSCQCQEPRLVEARPATLDQVAGKLAAAEYYCGACEWRRTEPLRVESRPA
jgi:hypothetical protein